MTREDNQPARVLAEGRFVRLLAKNGWEWADRTNCRSAVIIVAVTGQRELVLVEQFRIPLGRRVIELPAGLVGDEPDGAHEEPAEAARRELREETGFQAETMVYLAEGPSSAGLASEVYSLFWAPDVRQVTAGGGTAGEEIRVYRLPLDDAEAWLDARRREGVMVDPKIYAGLYFAQNPRGTSPLT
jgi:ADP-ribose pyrophosphatase